jgi:L-ascorbate metabolism protein UlaG (beta-lactamase superfamily)
MEIERKGANCIVISTKKYSFVVDPKISGNGLKDQGANATAELLTQAQFRAPGGEETVIIDGPGEYEVQNCSIKGIAVREHSQPEGAPKTATMYRLSFEDFNVAVLGNVAAKLTEDQLEAIGVVDILVLPVGGYGMSIEPKEAVDLVRSIEPKIVIPTHYAEDGVQYEVPQAPLEDFLKEMGGKHEEPVAKLKIKGGVLPEALTVQEITRTK